MLRRFFNMIRTTNGGLKRLLLAYLFNRVRWRLWLLFGVVLAAYAFNIKLAVLYNDWNGRFFNALQAVDSDGIFRELLYFIGLAAVIILLLVWAGYLKDRLTLALRRDLTSLFFNRWLSPDSAHYLLRESGREPDNPDQRITEDVKTLVAYAVSLAVSFYDSLLTIGSFSVILWNLSGSAVLFGFTIPGYMFWTCIIYTLIATAITHFIGRKLKPLNIEAQHREANLRAALIEKHRHSDSIAGARAESVEVAGLKDRLVYLVDVQIALLKRKRDLDLFTVSVGQFTHLAPIFFALPSFLSGSIQLGGLMQIRGAFNDVARSLSWFIMAYDDLMRLAAAYERLQRLEQGLTDADETHCSLAAARIASDVPLAADMTLSVPFGDKIRTVGVDLKLSPGTITLVTGPSGIGKSTLLQVLAGFRGGFQGDIASRGRIFWLPQRTYLPKGTLKAALTYPMAPGDVPGDSVRQLLADAGLAHLVGKLEETADWMTLLSGGEQQRCSLLRAVLASPDVLLADEMTSGLDEPEVGRMILLLRRRLPNTAILMVSHQDAVRALADVVITLNGDTHGQSIHSLSTQ